MSNDVIQADYEALEKVAARFGDESERVGEMNGRIQSAMRSLQNGGWEGKGSAAFFTEMEGTVSPASTRLMEALAQAQTVTLEVKRIIQEAEEEAARPFRNESANRLSSNSSMGASGNSEDSGVFDSIGSGFVYAAGWVGEQASDTWGWIEDHRNEVALGAAVVAAGVATVTTGGLAAPILAGALTAGGTTLAINGASERYTTWDGVLGNTVSGAFIGWGVGSAGAAISTLRGTAMATNWAAGTGAATAQFTQVSAHAMTVTRALTYAPPILNAIGGGSMVVSGGGLDIVIPDQYEGGVHTISNYVGMGSAVANLGLAVGGNQLIRRAWANPRTHPPGRSLIGGGNSGAFQSHHLYPQNQFGRLSFPTNILDDSVILPSGRNPFVPNLHWTRRGGIHTHLTQIIDRGTTPTLEVFQAANQQFVKQTILTGIREPATAIGIWGSFFGSQYMDGSHE